MRQLILAALSSLSLGLPAPGQSELSSAPPEVMVDTAQPLVKDAWGAGVQWDPSDLFDYTDAQWQATYDRVQSLHLGFIRCCTSPGAYWSGFDAAGAPVYRWDSPNMQRLYHILDFCQAHHVRVILGEWGPPRDMGMGDPRWSRMEGDWVDHLVREKGYTCIAAIQKVNEPGNMPDFDSWSQGQKGVKAALMDKGLGDQVVVAAPDQSTGNYHDPFILASAAKLSGTIGLYETHLYADPGQIMAGNVETTLRGFRETFAQNDPNAASLPYVMGEAGTSRWVGQGIDSNADIRDFIYGVYLADYFVQATRAGLNGMSAWMLDDSMHNQNLNGQAKGHITGDPKIDYNLKIWGMWNILGDKMGRPGDVNPRPWYAAWVMTSRCFPRGCTVLATGPNPYPDVRVGASMMQKPAGVELNFLIVNDGDQARTVRLRVPTVKGRAALRQYNYFKDDCPLGPEGTPTSKQNLVDVDVSNGFEVTLPGRGVIYLTTRDGATAGALR